MTTDYIFITFNYLDDLYLLSWQITVLMATNYITMN